MKDKDAGVEINVGGSSAQQLRRTLSSEQKAEFHGVPLRPRVGGIESPEKCAEFRAAQHPFACVVELR
ncbi:MAG: hypothetical protein WBW93_05575 [Steroidobacteraceae bacterium]